MNLGLRRLIDVLEDPGVGLPEFVPAMFLTARRRVRSALGFPPDEFDLMLPPSR